MKRLMPAFLLVPVLSSCVVQEGYYEPGYYPPPPPPVVEVHRHHHHGYRPAPAAQVRIEQHGRVHGRHHHGASAVVVHPGRPQVQPQVHVHPQTQPQVHVHQQTQPQVHVQPQAKPTQHGHESSNGAVVKPAPQSGSAVVIEHN